MEMNNKMFPQTRKLWANAHKFTSQQTNKILIIHKFWPYEIQ